MKLKYCSIVLLEKELHKCVNFSKLLISVVVRFDLARLGSLEELSRDTTVGLLPKVWADTLRIKRESNKKLLNLEVVKQDSWGDDFDPAETTRRVLNARKRHKRVCVQLSMKAKATKRRTLLMTIDRLSMPILGKRLDLIFSLDWTRSEGGLSSFQQSRHLHKKFNARESVNTIGWKKVPLNIT